VNPIDEELLLSEMINAEKVAPKLEVFRTPARYKLARGGRGSGKSWGVASLLVQRATQNKVKILCAREVQLSLEESVYALIVETIARLKYSGWSIKKESISHVNGSKFVFRGMKDLRAANAVKSMEGIDICWLEEAQSISHDSITTLIPTIRKEGSEIWATWNPETEDDPINELMKKPSAINILINWNDNPWFGDVLRLEMENDYKNDPDEAEHTWGGQPRKQGDNCIMSRVLIRQAMERIIKEPDGADEFGVDIARYGDDSTQIYHRKGLKIIEHKELRKADTIEVANAIIIMSERCRTAKIKIDEGYNPGVVDIVRRVRAHVVPISFGSEASDKGLYPNTASEMWFECPIKDIDIPDDPSLMVELADRRYSYDIKGRRQVEKKDDYKKRHSGKSPDKADALLLCFYTGKNITFSEGIRAQMRAARGLR
jgi:phage terminase large subunit